MAPDGRGSGRQGPSPGRVTAAAAAISTACVLPSFLLGAVAVQLRRDLAIDASGIGLAFAVFFAAAALASAPGGRLADRSNPARVVRVAGVVCASTSLLIAAFATELPHILTGMAVAGAANAVCQTAATLVIVQALPAGRRGFALAVKQSAIPAGTLVAGLAVPALVLTLGWRWAFVAAAIFALLSAAWAPGGTRSPPDPRQPPQGRGAVAKGAPDVPMPAMLRLAVAVVLAGVAASGLGSFLVSAAVSARLSEGAAGLLLSASSIMGIGVRLLAGAHADARGGAFRLVILMVGAGALALATLAIGLPVAYLLAAPLAFCTAWAWPGLFNLAVVQANPSSPAAATGITQTGQFIGAVVGPLLFGMVAEHAGYGAAWLTASGIALVAAAVLFSVRRHLQDG